MRDLIINQYSFYYALFRKLVNLTDADGNYIGEPMPVYNAPVLMKAPITSEKGEATAAIFGTNMSYDRVMTTHDMSCPIDENSVLCIDIAPTTDADGYMTNYDYIVKKKAKSKNVIAYALTKVL